MALRSFASARIQLVLPGGGVVMSKMIATTERATRVGVGIDLILPRPFGSHDAFVLSHWKVSWVISTTIQGGVEHTIGRASSARIGPQSSPLDVMRHGLAIGTVK